MPKENGMSSQTLFWLQDQPLITVETVTYSHCQLTTDDNGEQSNSTPITQARQWDMLEP